jgi:endoglucanase
MKKVILLSVFAFSTIIALAQNVNWVERNGALKVVDGKILNRKNIEPQLRGVSLSWSIWGGKKYYNQDVVNWLKSDFNINLLRVSMAVQPENGYLQDPLGQEKLITETIDAAIKRNLYVLIDWHDHHADEHLDQSKMFFAKMAKRYAGKPNVIYEIFNEPEKIAWQTVKDYAVQIIAEIRKYDAENVIVVGSPHWDQDIDVVAKDPIKGFSNIAYSFHFYASEPSHQEVLMKRADNAISAGLPIFVTEWGVGEANGDGVFDTSKTNKWFSWMEKNKLSWANWNITDKKETTALLMPDASPKGKWKPETLSPAGKYIRTKLRNLNK